MARVSSREAAELVNLLLSTPQSDLAERWPSLLTLLTRWATQARGSGAQQYPAPLPARPWERRQHQQLQAAPQQHPSSTTAHPQQQQQQQQQALLQQAADAVQQSLHQAALTAQGDPCGAAGGAVSKLFVPAVLFLAAALTAAEAPLAQQLQPAAVAAACEAAAALAASPPALLAGANGQQGAGLPAVLSSTTKLLVACQGDASHAAWLVSALLSALHSAVPNIICHTLQQHHQHQQQQQMEQQLNSPVRSGTSTGSSSSKAAFDSWRQQQLEQSVVVDTLGLLPGLYSLGHELGASCCRAAAAVGADLQSIPGTSSSNSSSSRVGGAQALPAVVAVLAAACIASEDALLPGLAGAVAAGLCAGVLESLPPLPSSQQAFVGPAAAAAAGRAGHLDFAAAADAAWKQGPSSTQQQQQQQQPASTHAASSSRQQLLQHVGALLQAVQAACSRCYSGTGQQQAPAAAATTDAAAAAVAQGLLGQAFGRLWSTCGHLLLPQHKQQQQQQEISLLPGLLCALQYLLGCCCSLSGVFYHATASSSAPDAASAAAAANAWLAAQQQQHPAHEVGQLARWLAATAAAAAAVTGGPAHGLAARQEPLPLLQQLLSALRGSGAQLAGSYSMLQLAAPAAVLAGLDAAAVRQQLDRTFAVHVVLLSELWLACKAETQLATAAAMPPSLTPAAVAAAEQPGAGGQGASAEPLTNLNPVPDLQAVMVAQGLGDLASLQFCRVQLPAYVELLQGLVAALASSSTAAGAFVSSALPCYEHLTQPHPAAAVDAAAANTSVTASSSSSSGSGSWNSTAGLQQAGSREGVVPAAVWLQDSVTAAELTFLLPLLPVAVRAAGGGEAAAAAARRVLPLLLLLLPHPLPAVSQAAHASYAGLAAVAAEQQQQQQSAPAAEADFAQLSVQQQLEQQPLQQQQQQQQQQGLMDLVQQSVPMYLQRSLASLPACGSLDGLAASYYSLLRNTPSGSVLGLLAVQQLADKTLQLANAAAAAAADAAQSKAEAAVADASEVATGTAADVVGSPAAAADAAAAAAAQKLFDLLVLSLQGGDYQLLPAMLDKVAACVLGAPPSLQQGWLGQMYAGCVGVGDYTRKPALVAWVDGLRRQLFEQQQRRRLLSRRVSGDGSKRGAGVQQHKVSSAELL